MRRMSVVENTINAYRNRSRSDNWAKWASDNPEQQRLIILAERERDTDDGTD